MRELADRYQVHRQTIGRQLANRGVRTRVPARRLDLDQCREAATLYETGLTLQELGERFRVNPETIRKALVRSGVIIRPKGRIRTPARTELAGSV